MEEQQKKDVAVFRFGVISDFVTRGRMDRGEQERLLAQKCQMTWQIPHSNRSRLARSTILGWIRAYRKSGGRLESLYPSGRNDRGVSRTLDEETASVIAFVQFRQIAEQKMFMFDEWKDKDDFEIA